MTQPPVRPDWSVDEPELAFSLVEGEGRLAPSGDWTIRRASKLEALVAEVQGARGRTSAGSPLVVDLARIGLLDTVGVLVLNRLMTGAGERIRLANATESQTILIDEVLSNDRPPVAPPRAENPIIAMLMSFGRIGRTLWLETAQGLSLLGAATLGMGRWLTLRTPFRFSAFVTQLERTGLNAAPIIALMSFLIGAILAQQGTFYFRRFGADIYVVDLAGVLTLRELGVLLTAIMVAGRSGSAITAELGSMKMREEVDALRVVGLDPVEVLILPRVLALIVALPILTFISDLAAIFGAALDSATYAGIPGDVFLTRLQSAIDLQTFFVGMSKAPFMALIIGLIASLEGLQVAGSAESLGAHTTQAVVKSIFFVIVVDGIFAVFFAAVGV